MLTVENRLKAYMEKGYDINIECKGDGRTYSMTYEATIKHSTPDHWFVIQSHAVGSTLDELLNNLDKNFKENKL